MTTLRLQLKAKIKWYLTVPKPTKEIKWCYRDMVIPNELIDTDWHKNPKRYHIENLIRPFHIAASLLRGRKFEQIENYKKWKKGKHNKPDFTIIRKVVNYYAKEHYAWIDGASKKVPAHKYLNQILDHLKEVEKCIDSM